MTSPTYLIIEVPKNVSPTPNVTFHTKVQDAFTKAQAGGYTYVGLIEGNSANGTSPVTYETMVQLIFSKQ